MYLKEIKLNGFKSFADKLKIEFNQGITCIVGPNGAGKSNLVDAVRWVLGEQSVKSLRGEGGMSDVIFSGSKTRQNLNVASVELIFDNSDDYLSIDYSEVSVKRRVYNTGENEYFLNNESCRLKDIVNLFTETGMGKSSFNIISQGEIHKIISSRPEERRIIFEDAAGVSKYKRKKEEATRRLVKTDDNLRRINDIINELKLQVTPLKEQSSKAEEYLKYKEDLENIELALITHDITDLNYTYQDLKKQITSLNEELITIETNLNTSSTTMETEKITLQKLDDTIHEQQQELIKLTRLVEKLKGRKQLSKERQKYQVPDQALHNNITNLKETALSLTNHIASLESDLNHNNELLIASDKNINHLTNQLQNHYAERDDNLHKLELNMHQEQKLKHEIELLRMTIDNNSSVTTSVRNILNHPKLTGIHGIIGRLIDTDEQYAKAIETSLGFSMQFIVVDNELKAQEAIKYLKENNLGRATFFPLNVISPKGIDYETLDIVKKHPAFIDIAANLTTYDTKYRHIILNQLGNVLVVDNLKSANEISRLIKHRYKIVTLDGELIHVGGSITGGAYQKQRGMIKEKYELEDMHRKLRFIMEDKNKLITNKDSMLDKIKTVETALLNEKANRVSIEEVNKTKRITLAEYQDRLTDVNSELSSLQNVVGGVVEDVTNQLLNEYYKTEQKKKELEKILKDLNKKRSQVTNQISDLEALIQKANHLYRKRQTELKDLEITLNRVDVKLDNLLNTLTNEYTMTYEKAKENYQLDMDVALARQQVNSLQSRIKKLGVINLGAVDEYKRVHKRYTFLTTQRDDLLKAKETLFTIIQEMDTVMEQKFLTTFKLVKEEFKTVFKKLFGGGSGELSLTEPNQILTTGVDINASPPGKKLKHLSLLSGGEKTLTAIALLFAILNVKKIPFCLFDEIEAALDELNVNYFGEYLQTYRGQTQFIIITHKKKTMTYGDALYGITMQESGVSKLVSVKLDTIKN